VESLAAGRGGGSSPKSIAIRVEEETSKPTFWESLAYASESSLRHIESKPHDWRYLSKVKNELNGKFTVAQYMRNHYLVLSGC
jgi:hypothetical protein